MVESVRRGVVPLIAFVAACLGQLCLVNLVELPTQLHELTRVNPRFAGWVAAGACAGIIVALLVLVAAPRLRAAAPLAVGTTASVFGLALGRAVTTDVQLALALLMLGVAAGGLLGGAVSLTTEPSVPHRTWTAAAWAAPLIGAPAVLDWLALRSSSPQDLRLTLHPPLWGLGFASLLLMGWCILTLLIEADSADTSVVRPAETTWTALVTAAVMPTLAAMLVGFGGGMSVEWLRPLVVAISGATVLGLGLACLAMSRMPSGLPQRGCAAAFAILLCWPSVVSLLLLAEHSESGRRMVLLVALAGAMAGTVWGLAQAHTALVGGQLLVAAGAAAAWLAVSGAVQLLAAPTAVITCGGAAAVVGGVRGALPSSLAVRLVGGAAVGATMLGGLLALPLAWALGGVVPSGRHSATVGAQVLLGLLTAGALLSAGYAATGRTPNAPQSTAQRTTDDGSTHHD